MDHHNVPIVIAAVFIIYFSFSQMLYVYYHSFVPSTSGTEKYFNVKILLQYSSMDKWIIRNDKCS